MSGDILFLAHRLPYPPDRGDRIRSWHVLKALAQRAPVHVIALIDKESDRQYIAKVETTAASVLAFARSTSKLEAMAGALATGLPASVMAFKDARVLAAVRNCLADNQIKTIYAFSGQMAASIPPEFSGRFVMDFVDMDSAKFAQQGGFANRQEAKRLQAFETRIAKHADVSLFVSQAEAVLFTGKTGCAAHVLENGIDLNHFEPQSAEPHQRLIVFTGQMDYGPNVEAVTNFVHVVLPHIANAHFAIVGRAPTAAVKALASARVTVTGEVPDTRPWLARAAVVVAPLKLARGVQNKVLEAMAMGKAVVLSTGAAQGIDATDGIHFIVADDPAQAVTTLLDDPARAERIGAAARLRMVERYSWDAQMLPLSGFLAL